MAAKALFEFVTQCVTNLDHRLKIRHEASDESISATASHLLKRSNWNALCAEIERCINKS
jgi:hypothetical protein